MPVVGILCEKRGPVSFEKCLGCAATFKQKCEFRLPIIYKIIQGLRQKREGISATDCTGCIRQSFFKRFVKYHIGLEEAYWMFRGSITHEIIYGVTENVRRNPWSGRKYGSEDNIVEKRFSRIFVDKDGSEYVISGRPDWICISAEKLEDWKTAKAVPRYKNAYKGHQAQLNIYAWILAGNGIKISTAEAVYLDMACTKPIEVQLWPEIKVTRFLQKTLVPLTKAIDTKIPPPKPKTYEEGLWLCNGYCPAKIQKVCAEVARKQLILQFKKAQCAKCPARAKAKQYEEAATE